MSAASRQCNAACVLTTLVGCGQLNHSLSAAFVWSSLPSVCNGIYRGFHENSTTIPLLILPRKRRRVVVNTIQSLRHWFLVVITCDALQGTLLALSYSVHRGCPLARLCCKCCFELEEIVLFDVLPLTTSNENLNIVFLSFKIAFIALAHTFYVSVSWFSSSWGMHWQVTDIVQNSHWSSNLKVQVVIQNGWLQQRARWSPYSRLHFGLVWEISACVWSLGMLHCLLRLLVFRHFFAFLLPTFVIMPLPLAHYASISTLQVHY